MVSELIVMVTTGKEDRDKTRQFIEKNHRSGLFSLIDIVHIRHDTSGKISFQVYSKESVYPMNNNGRLATAFAEVIFEASHGESRGQLVEAGLDPYFLRKVTQALKPDSSAYLLYVPKDSLIDSRHFLEILEEQQGALYHTTFRSQVEEVLLKKIADD